MIILGSTGSIGINAIDIAIKNHKKIEMLSVGDNIDLLNKQIQMTNPTFIVIKDKKNANKVRYSNKQKLFFGESGILEALNLSKSKIVINAIVGFSGLKPSLEVIKLNKKLALANKESLVVGGKLLDSTNIIPVDSEHFALKELIGSKKNIKKMIITASGGALRDCKTKDLYYQTPQNALNHPNWAMGKKITIDSATMINKLFEILEAKWLFKTNNIDALIERNSIIHALIQTNDNAFYAHLGSNDMKLPISYAILGKKAKNIDSIKEIDLTNYTFNLKAIDTKHYPLWNLKDSLLQTPQLGIILNAANEILVSKFLDGKIPFGKISDGIFSAIARFSNDIKNIDNISDIQNIDNQVRNFSDKI
ncbi:1-deoxy-D-xylulose-5-phosphate reductoisomerase [Helicobacter sp. 16-1353]|uniref:1-deoxy-D-xylulose-5-phosphate reductoisomerase n=1 Tax=Helicobacter sp. 16-1353 TaxID=2004996 RepID=UPI000DCAEA1A|nr:1-deoxy-D-xylulose-5-phosphate reductoisomerase [Helicobacter sp. 16-1353]RAX51714.1 1-deoxy-D-xylulose-5-phosphate reductoisomerase [Helicobacter sp. 16-1353]